MDSVFHREREITSPVDLCDPRGNLNPAAIAWSRRPLHRCNLQGHWPRKKEWDYWCITSDRHLFSATLANIDYMGLAFVYFLDFQTSRFTEQTVMVPFGRGCRLPETVGADISFENRAMSLAFSREPGEPGGIRLRIASPNFGGAPLRADLLVTRPEGHESLNVVIPWSNRRFQFTSKHNCLPAAGSVSVGNETFAFEPGRAFACLDFGRGIWRYSSFWNWASFSGVCRSAEAGDRTVGVNLGGGWTDGTGMTENGICLDGKLTKLSEDVAFEYDRCDFMRPWRIRSTVSDRVDLQFIPFFERVASTNLIILKSTVHQLIGRFSGRVLTDQGLAVQVQDVVGWAEEHRARW